MPSDLRSTDTATRSPAPERPSPPASSTSRPLLRTFLVCFFAALYALAAIRWSLPPHSWVEKWIARRVSQDRAAWTRPGLRTVERFGREAHQSPVPPGTLRNTSTGPPLRLSLRQSARTARCTARESTTERDLKRGSPVSRFTLSVQGKASHAPRYDPHDHEAAPGQPTRLAIWQEAHQTDDWKRSSGRKEQRRHGGDIYGRA
ncbi:hypothetical protein OF846_004606 [Rhodotorula toruloides]|nr:hypothetical protein OF846_004606 [Rhodotorula toruloides]